MLQPRAAAIAIRTKNRTQTGQRPSRTKFPLENTVDGYLKKNSNMGAPALVRHRINDVVDADSKSKGGEPFWVKGIVGVLPRVAEVHIMTDGHHQSAFVVIDAAPAGLI